MIVQREVVQDNLDPPVLIHEFHGPVQDSQVGQTQEVHLQQTQLGHRVHGILGHQHRAVFVTTARPLQRNSVGQRLVGDQHAGRVGADMVDITLQSLGNIHQFFGFFLALVGLLKFGVDP